MKILFVCSGNAYRSPVAEALLKKFKPEIEVRALFSIRLKHLFSTNHARNEVLYEEEQTQQPRK